MSKQPEATVLIVEDNPDILELVRSLLESEGYRVLTAENGEDARIRFAENQDIALVFTDLILPHGQSGVELVKEMSRERRHCAFLLGTGYTSKDKSISASLQDKRHMAYIAKPYDLDDLAKEVRYLIGKQSLTR